MIKKGETLIEVIAALSCIVLAGLAAVTVSIQVMSTTATSKEFLIAQNLAREAIEGVVNIRDTNWLLFPTNKDECWLIKDSSECNVSKAVKESTSYILGRETNGQNILREKTGVTLDIPEGGQPDSADSKFLLYVDSNNIYTHQIPATKASPYPFPDFYRMITFSKIDADADTMQINVKVQWMHKGSIPKTYELSSVITNYAK
ncbi:MAG: hypothetical protein WC604_00920 [Candidatus Gracilibacteria bacterium]